MARVRFTGNAQVFQQEDVRVVTAPVANNTLTVTVNGKVFTYTCASAVAADEAAAFVDAYNAQEDIGEIKDAEASATSASVIFASREAGRPFTFAYAGTGGTTFPAGTGAVSNGGPWVLDTTANWSSAPIAASDLVFDKPNANVLYRLDQLAAVTFASMTVMGSWNGGIGLPIQNADNDYPEYRECFLSLDAPLLMVGAGEGPGPERCYVKFISAGAVVAEVLRSQQGTDWPAVMFHGTSTVSSCRVMGGDVGLAAITGQTLTVTTLQVGGGDSGSPSVKGGIGLTLANLTIVDGTADLWSMPTTLCKLTGGATVRAAGGGNCTTVNVDNGVLLLGGTGALVTLMDLTVGEAGVFDLSEGTGSVAITNGIKLRPGFTIKDPLNRLAVGTVLNPESCSINEGTIITGPGRTYSIAS